MTFGEDLTFRGALQKFKEANEEKANKETKKKRN